jgi:trehalose 6-phosphate phosphatase
MDETVTQILERVCVAPQLALFLDYDGTLAEFAPTPDHILPNPQVIERLTRLASFPHLHLAVISGRRLSHIQALLPVPHILLAGTYGLELQLPDGRQIDRLQITDIRPTLDRLKPQWAALIAARTGFYLEDKVWSLALHARLAEAAEAETILQQARQLAVNTAPFDRFHLLGGHRFFEVAPLSADKGLAVDDLLDRFMPPEAMPVYLGDDDKDEAAFVRITARGGIALVVAAQPRETHAQGRLTSPAAVRSWLAQLQARLVAQTAIAQAKDNHYDL